MREVRLNDFRSWPEAAVNEGAERVRSAGRFRPRLVSRWEARRPRRDLNIERYAQFYVAEQEFGVNHD